MADQNDPADPDDRFGAHWLRMSTVLLAELQRRDLMDTPEAQAMLGARRRLMRRAPPTRKLRKRRPETRWEAFLRVVGKGPKR